MNSYHTYYLSTEKSSVELWDFNTKNEIQIIGEYDHNGVANDFLSTVKNITNKSVIDIGCRDGYYSFLFEKLGNNVTSMDIDDTEVRRYVTSFLNSNVSFIHENVYSIINWESDVKYDIVFVGDLLVHLENPLGALKLFHTICNEKLLILTDYYEDDISTNIQTTYSYNEDLQSNGSMSHGHLMYPWLFSKKALFSILHTCGYGDIKILGEYDIPSKNIKSIPLNESFTRKTILIEACPLQNTFLSNLNYVHGSGYKINPHFSSLYPNFKI